MKRYALFLLPLFAAAAPKQTIVIDPQERATILSQGALLIDRKPVKLKMVDFDKVRLFNESKAVVTLGQKPVIAPKGKDSKQIDSAPTDVNKQLVAIAKDKAYQPKGKFSKNGKPYLMIGFNVIGVGGSFETAKKEVIFIDSIDSETYTLRLGNATIQLAYPFVPSIK
ncbi:MAG: hypothetical protein A2Y14_05380 [Verrucomicrobia bacterium GWF2_51_19]|nr:MAG: hypothetical protein A2Y14_05380 [Verrucomicrobia bacterium GWF2_51_19]HCJ12441.1 hypothetical protein [Opitutae bacterium]